MILIPVTEFCDNSKLPSGKFPVKEGKEKTLQFTPPQYIL